MDYDYYVTIQAKGQPNGSPSNEFEIDDFSFDIEQVLNIGSSSSGTGSGKVTFNPFQITKKTDSASPQLFEACTAGEVFPKVVLEIFRPGKGGTESRENTVTLKNAVIQKVVPIFIEGKLAHKFSFGFEEISVESMSPVLTVLSRG